MALTAKERRLDEFCTSKKEQPESRLGTAQRIRTTVILLLKESYELQRARSERYGEGYGSISDSDISPSHNCHEQRAVMLMAIRYFARARRSGECSKKQKKRPFNRTTSEGPFGGAITFNPPASAGGATRASSTRTRSFEMSMIRKFDDRLKDYKLIVYQTSTKMTIDRAGRPPAPRRASSTYRSYDELGAIETGRLHRPLRQKHPAMEDLTGIEHHKFVRNYDTRNLDDITVISSEEIKPRRKTMEGLASGFRRTFSVRSRRDPDPGIPMDTFSVICEDSYATVRGAPFGRRRSLSRDRSTSLLARSSSEGDVRSSSATHSAPPAHPTPRLHRCLRALGGSWKNLLLCNAYAPPAPTHTSYETLIGVCSLRIILYFSLHYFRIPSKYDFVLK
ncbi:hypothetical protein EVAR_53550_1 [Eumeta japonica]|uniref:Uncharacterized protein n=1 Tax=Eumeta variegata TaxID=151549 RepID=A0A4C1YV02_EUMVA|nr:hypothetical protein EVAR_53550_1 [Eumeta japonica]